MPRPIKYDVICDQTLEKLIKKVNVALQEGWTLVGGISYSPPTCEYFEAHMQAVCKIEESIPIAYPVQQEPRTPLRSIQVNPDDPKSFKVVPHTPTAWRPVQDT